MNTQDIQDLKQLIDFLRENQVAEFDLDRGDLKIRLKFNQPSIAEVVRALPTPQSVTSVDSASLAVPPPPAPPEQQDADAGLHILKSPIVGTFYGSPSPGASSFVGPGDRVNKGQVICIVEAMKLMNEIESDVAGEVVKCFVSNGQAIEYGQPLFSIRTA